MYWREILWLISWPLMIWVIYVVITSAIKKYESKVKG
ncbi:MAG: hypothetical protein BWX61_01157 [Bacteroidetes bacterium ADurb.Bin035]|nr:MAG: hypothetical protein BWX61_01157 [Bacteroidetes bacterium ADurb.Bin035]